jgi:hypothetical protein
MSGFTGMMEDFTIERIAQQTSTNLVEAVKCRFETIECKTLVPISYGAITVRRATE